jgi:transcriptional regulator with XRE-family HTH domain
MVIGEKWKTLREQKNLYQGDVEKRTGLLRFYISRVENGHTVPAIETLEKLTRAMGVPQYQIFYDGEKPPAQNPPRIDDGGWGSPGRDARVLSRFRGLMSRTDKGDLKLLLFMAQKMSQRKKRGNRAGAECRHSNGGVLMNLEHQRLPRCMIGRIMVTRRPLSGSEWSRRNQ